MKAPFLIGRLLFGGFFLYNGINHFKNRGQMAQYAASKGVPQSNTAVAATGALLVFGGASIITGILPKLGTAAIAAFLGGVSPVMHDFWQVENDEQRTNQMIHFSKNAALLGADLVLMGIPEPWSMSLPLAQPSRLERVKKFARRSIAA
jgi:putative oxidoreductase